MSRPFKSLEEMETIRKADAILKEQQAKDFVPEAVEYEDKALFVVSRCIRGPQGWKGFFQVSQLIVDDGKGKKLKKPIRKVIAEGVDMVVAMSSMETALRRKVFK